VLLGGLRGPTVEYTRFGYGEILNFQNLFIAVENFEARAVPLHSISVTPRKLCLAPKVLLGGLRGRTVQYATFGYGELLNFQNLISKLRPLTKTAHTIQCYVSTRNIHPP